ncbi:MAG: helix-turn-helix domain-containing protein [Flavobacterium sp.]|uniref:helix-turn-helix domain-containing protein n=1 Tax=Flavobacterium sp. TaxID=239 RepID=UPI00261342EF|nr:helix-turn-helix domain-containing protein [Flavobacterium sp.]MDD5150486.1 helix-turn-helix domain-containing protein [Flavobacterium sp.]
MADKILFFWFIIIGFHLFLFYLYYNKIDSEYPYLLGINIPLPLFHGPFLYLYTKAITNQLKNWKINLLHFLPVIISYLLLIDFFQLSDKEKILIFENQGNGFENIINIIIVAIFCSGIIYVFLSIQATRKHKKSVLNQFSNNEKINISWLNYLVYGIGISWLFVIYGNDEILFTVVVLFVIFIGYFGINQVGIFTNTDLLKLETESIFYTFTEPTFNSYIVEDKVPNNQKYEKSGLKQETAIEIHKLLCQKIENEKWFTNSELTLFELAQNLNVLPNKLSQVINTFEGKNFYDYINSKRVELFLKLVENPENRKYTILSLAFDCGFNSKSSFNKHFKKITNQTPSVYINSLENRLKFQKNENEMHSV